MGKRSRSGTVVSLLTGLMEKRSQTGTAAAETITEADLPGRRSAALVLRFPADSKALLENSATRHEAPFALGFAYGMANAPSYACTCA